MPVEFLTPTQEAKYGNFNEEPTSEQLAKFFLLDDQDRRLIFQLRADYNQLGFAIQLGTVRFLGTFLANPAKVPPNVSNYISQQLNIDASCLSYYRSGRSTRNHAQEIKKIYGYHDFSENPYHWRLVRWIYTRAWITAERPSVLFDLVTARCVEQKILLPGVTVVARLISQIRERAATRLWCKLTSIPNKHQRSMLKGLLKVDEKTKKTGLEMLKQPPTSATASGIIKAIERYEELYSLGSSEWNISKIPIGRIKLLSRYASMARAQTISRMNNERCIATLVSFTIFFTISALDDVIDVMEQIFTELFKRSIRKEQKTRLRTIKDLDKAARKLRDVCNVLLNDEIINNDMRKMVFSKISREDLKAAVQTVDTLTKPDNQTVAFEELFKNYSMVRRFFPKLLYTLNFQATAAGKNVLSSWEFLKNIESKTGKNKYINAPIDKINPLWKRHVLKHSNNKINPYAYTFWVIEQILEALKRHDIYILNSEKYGDIRSQLLHGEEWESVKPHVLRTLDLNSTANEKLEILGENLNKSYNQTIERWQINPNVRIETFDGHDRLILSPLDRLEESEAVKWLRKSVQYLIPRIDLPELILEVNRWVKFTDAFTHISQGGSRVNDLDVSICAVLISQACNIGLEPVVKQGIPALEYDRLTWVTQNYFRTETLTQANAALVDYNAKLSLAKIWGGGEVASADGLRFVTPVKTINSRSNSKYFGTGRGVTYYNYTSDQFTGFNGIVIPGTIRDSLYLLQGILEQQTMLQPKEIMTDTAGYSDIIFGLFGLLGYQFSPRIADIGSAKFWRLDYDIDYGVLNELSKHKIRKDIIIRYWEDMLRVAGSLKLGAVNSVQLIQTLQSGGKPTMLGRAIGELGRIYKTQHNLTYIDDEAYRRKILTQLNRGESRHSLARAVFYGKKGELHQAYREGQEDQLGALGLIVNAIVV
jgi:TnpA family transposase